MMQSLHFNILSGCCWAGTAGSAALRGLALRGLCSLIHWVGPGDAWAFALPGVCGRLAKALLAAGWYTISFQFQEKICLKINESHRPDKLDKLCWHCMQ